MNVPTRNQTLGVQSTLRIQNIKNKRYKHTCARPADGSNFPSVDDASTFLKCASIRAAGTSSCKTTLTKH